MPGQHKLRGKEDEIVTKHAAGKTPYKLAVEYDVYPNAIRALLKRMAEKKQQQQPG